MTLHRTALRGLALAAAFAATPALAQAPGPSGDAAYSYKRPSPTTITTFGSLLDLCATATDSGRYDQDHGVCVGYISGFVDLYLAETPAGSRFICLPDPPITRQQAHDRFLVWASSHPEYAAQPATVGLYRFMTSTYPCAGAASAAPVPAPLAAPPVRP